jgi:predicted AlkP superfamily phosphohydrolase/phosphomutase
VLLVSDHGFGGAGTTALHLNRWLAEENYLAFTPRRRRARWAAALRGAAVRAVPARWQAPCFRAAGGRLANRLESGVRFGGIDWPGTQAFSEELNYFPAVSLNVQGRERCGTVRAADYEAVCEQLTDRLLAWRDPLGGGRVVRHVWRREALYRGAQTGLAPDLVLDLETPGGYSYVGLPSYGEDGPAIERMNGSALGGGKLAGMSGSHRADGLFLLCGEGVAPGRCAGAQIADMAPSILALCGLPVPAEWDGRPLPCVTPNGVGAAAGDETGGREVAYGAVEEADLQRRLAQLGYLA